MANLTKTVASLSLLFEPFDFFFEKSLIFMGKLCLKLTKCVKTILMRLFGYPYNYDLVISCTDSSGYLTVVVLIGMLDSKLYFIYNFLKEQYNINYFRKNEVIGILTLLEHC